MQPRNRYSCEPEQSDSVDGEDPEQYNELRPPAESVCISMGVRPIIERTTALLGVCRRYIPILRRMRD